MIYRKANTMNNDICVLIPHYNNPEGLYKTIQSISANDPVDICIVDDGSDVKPDEKAVRKAYKGEGSIKLIYLPCNQGIVGALNTGLKFIENNPKYTYIGRIDCGDTCIGERFTIQKEFMDDNKNIMLCGSAVNYINTDGDILFTTKPETKHSKINIQFLYKNPFAHPSIIFRSKLLLTNGYYSSEFKHIEDYTYFYDVSKIYKTSNLTTPLINYEVDERSITGKNRTLQLKSMIRFIYTREPTTPRTLLATLYLSLKIIVSRKNLMKIKKILNT